MAKGKLKLAKNNRTWLLVREDGKEMQVLARALARGLSPLDPKKHDGLDVEYDLDKGQPTMIREVGAEWQPQPTAQPTTARPYARGESSPQSRPEYQTSRVSLPTEFHNPYNFVPAPPRKSETMFVEQSNASSARRCSSSSFGLAGRGFATNGQESPTPSLAV